MTRFAYIFFAVYLVFVGSTYYFNLFPVRVAHHVLFTAVALIWLLSRLRKRQGLPKTSLDLPIVLMILVWIISTVLSLDVRVSLETLWFPLGHLLMFYVLVDLFRTGRQRLVIEITFLLAAATVCMAGLQLGSWFFGWGLVPDTQVGWASVLGADMLLPLRMPQIYMPLGVSTWLAAYTAPLVLLTAAWSIHAVQRDVRIVLRILSGLLFFIMLMTNSRGGFVSLGVGVGAFIFFRILSSDLLRRLPPRKLIPLVVAPVIVLALAGVGVLVLSQAPGHSSGDVLRRGLWEGAVDIIVEQPVEGAGVGMFGRTYRMVRDGQFVDDRLGTAHNVLLNITAENGVMGFIVLAIMIVVFLRATWVNWQHADAHRRLRIEAALAALIGFAIQNLFDVFQSTPLVLLFLTLVVICIIPPTSRLAPRPTLPVWTTLLAIFVFGAFAVMFFRWDQALASHNRSVDLETSSLEGAIASAQEAIELDPALNLYHLQYDYLVARQALAQGDWQTAIDHYQHAVELEPTWDTGWINLGLIYELIDEDQSALEALAQATAINRANVATFNSARVSEISMLEPDDLIISQYVESMRQMPLSEFWTATELRQSSVARYREETTDINRFMYDLRVGSGLVTEDFPQNPTTATEYWMRGIFRLELENDPVSAYEDFTQALLMNRTWGDAYASRARAGIAIGDDFAQVQRDLRLAVLLGTTYESPNAISALIASTPEDAIPLLAGAVQPQYIEQNFEGVLFLGRRASFLPLSTGGLPGPGTAVLQPWYDLAIIYQIQGDIDGAVNVYHAILNVAPEETRAQNLLAELEGSL